jgi:hypothetical protein
MEPGEPATDPEAAEETCSSLERTYERVEHEFQEQRDEQAAAAAAHLGLR